MKEKLIKDIEIALSTRLSEEDRETVMHVIISAMRDYEVAKAVTDLAVRHEDVNEKLMKRYAACMMIDGKAEGTIRQYLRTLRKLEEAVNKPFTKMKTDDIRYFLGGMKMRGSKNSHIENQRSYISAFFQWLFDEEEIEKNPCRKIKTIKVEEEIRLPFSAVEIDKLRTSCRRQIDRAIIELLLSSGVRREELCNLKVCDINLEKRTVSVRDGKGGKDRMTYISDIAAQHIRLYLKGRKTVGPYLFVPQSGREQYGDGSIWNIVHKLGKKANVDDVHPHRFRRTFATDLYKRGMDIASISKLMGHTNIEVTKRYIHIANEQLESDYRRYAA